ncbi:junctophilin-3 [Eucyclogobius newberryi]|uniref:junctophilin-3 n=1 Tax=Eucyclogobius newberryi TaxID=166745 RepID=UPI003B5A67D6
MSSGGRFDFDDGGWYCGGWDQGKAHGRGVCTGPQTQGEYAGAWSHGFELLGVYSWPSGGSYKGTWAQGKRHGVGVETKACWEYRGEWTQGLKGRYGQLESTTSGARYEGTWSNGLQDGYGTETYSDGGTYQGQWLGGMRHGYGVRQSVPYGMAALILFPLRTSINSLRSDHSGPGPLQPEEGPVVPGDASSAAVSGLSPVGRGGFALTAPSEAERRKRKGRLRQSILSGLKLRRSESKSSLASQLSKQSSYCSETGMSTVSSDLQSNHSQQGAPIDATVTEMYAGEWRTDQRTGLGIGRRSDGLTYSGEWLGNKRHGYGCTTFPDGTKEEGKYKQNILVSGKRKNLIPLRASKIREKVDRSVEAAEKASDVAKQKAEIALSRMSHARGKAESAETVAQKALEESRLARITAKELSPSFHIYENGLESERPKHTDGPEPSSGSESPLCTPDTTPSALTPDFSPIAPASPPKQRSRKTCFHRQSALDDQAEIQVLVEGRGLELQRGGANHTWAEDRYSSRSTTPSLLEETEGQINGHEPVVVVANHKPRDKTPLTNHKPRDTNSHFKTWEHSLSNQKPSKHGSSNHKTREYSSSNHKTWDHSSANHSYKPQLHVLANHKGPDHTPSNHKAAEHVSSNHHKPQDYASTNHSVKEHATGYGNHKQHNHRPSAGHAHHWSPAHSQQTDERSGDYKDHYTVDMRLSDSHSPCPSRPRPRLRPVREGSVDSVQRLDRLALEAEPEDRGAWAAEGEGTEPWPMNRDLTLSTPLRSPPIIDLEPEPESSLKTHSGSSSFLVVMVILLNIGVAILFIHFFI